VALGDQVYLMDHQTGKTQVIVRLNKDDSSQSLQNLPYICSVNFDRSGEALAIGTSDKQINIYDVNR